MKSKKRERNLLKMILFEFIKKEYKRKRKKKKRIKVEITSKKKILKKGYQKKRSQ